VDPAPDTGSIFGRNDSTAEGLVHHYLVARWPGASAPVCRPANEGLLPFALIIPGPGTIAGARGPQGCHVGYGWPAMIMARTATDSLPAVRDQTIEAFLTDLAARTAAPGGGAAAALQAALAAALLAMVARYSAGPKYAADASAISLALAEADRLRDACADLIAADAAAFGAVAAAYRLPKDSDELAAERSAAIAAALAGAADPPAAVIAACARLLKLADILLPVGNRTVIADVAAAAEAIRAAVATARVNVEVNLAGITDAEARARFTEVLSQVDALEARAAEVGALVRAELAR
jgi:methenyltetrahydrofolate cyclohydrolase